MNREPDSRARIAAVVAAVVLGCCVGGPCAAAAQDGGPPEEGAAAERAAPPLPQLPAGFFEPLRVPLVNVEVVVTDGSGAVVEGLGSEDFEVLQDGVPVVLSHFAAPGAPRPVAATSLGAPFGFAPAVERSYLAVYLDEVTADPQLRASVLARLRSYLERSAPPEASLMLARFDGRLHVEADFATSADQLLAAVDRLSGQPAMDSTLDGEALLRRMQSMAQRPRAPDTSVITTPNERGDLVPIGIDPGEAEPEAYIFLPEIQQYARSRQLRGRTSLDGLQRYLGLLEAIPGRKRVLWVGGIELRPGESLFRSWQDLFRGAAQRRGSDAMTESLRYDLSRELSSLLELANAAGVVLYPVSALAGGVRDTAASDTRALESPGRPGRQDHRDTRSQEEAAGMMAVATGGRRLTDGARLDEQIAAVAGEGVRSYSLAFRPPSAGDGAHHSIEVKLRRPGVSVRHRAGYRDPGEGLSAATRTVAAAVLGTADNQLGVAAVCEPQEPREDGSFLVPVRLTVPIGNLVLLPLGDRHTARISVLSVVRDGAGGLSEVYERAYPIELPNEELVAAVEQPATFVLGMVLRPGPYRIAICVRDDRSLADSTVIVDVTAGEDAGSPSG
ncbi:MAG: VWA domain-containing protein [Thermoanaerobaculales bacterium]|nr:VWA domain-containing protein [Thermoanaerobaculales bacterium]